jgi:DNA-binding MarR family transcriptional regulator
VDPQPIIRVPERFAEEFPDCSALATEAFLNVGMLTGGVRAEIESLLAQHGITSAAAFNVMTVVGGDTQPIPPAVIAQRMMVTRPTVTGLLDSLERRGFLERAPSSGDRRAGRRAVRALVPTMHRFERDLMTALGERELRAFLRAVAKLQHRLSELAPDSPLGIAG